MVKAIAVVTVSDSCFTDPAKDTSGPTLAGFAKQLFPDATLHTIVIPDEKDIIERELLYFSDEANVDLVLTTGGTGLSRRDVTPEATKAVIHRDVPAISVAMTIDSLQKTSMAMLSRSVAGIRNRTLIINFPGSKKAVTECFEVVKPVLSHAVGLLTNDEIEVKGTHDKVQGFVCHHKHGMANSCVDISKVAFRPRESPFPMVDMSEAFAIIDEVMQQWSLSLEVVPIGDSLGRVVAEAIYAKEPMPPFPASMKDGYACISSDGAGVRRVRAALTAGDAPTMPLSFGECVRINTGAALPARADCVVQVEDTKLVSASEDGQTELEVEVVVPPRPQQDVRPIGCDIAMGAVLADKGAILDAAMIGVLAGAGYQNVTVRSKPKVALMSTGNELQEPSELQLKPAHVRDSNRTMLRVLLKEHGFDSIDCGIAQDEPTKLVSAISTSLSQADILVCTGGVSMGERDLLKPVLVKDFGATLHFGRVRMKPGKPSTFATCEFQGRKKYVFALPGNPVSAYVCAHLFLLRALRQCCHLPPFLAIRVKLAHAAALDARPEYARATLRYPTTDDLPKATLIMPNQSSSRLLNSAGATVLLQLPGATDTTTQLEPGAVVTAYLIGRPY
ncbi:gephyrin [Plutella xylostella]|uniref:gephyrin n=1 Tax=Plutella xylostella TaxID=51655 RepID=UPI002033172D|nr:gephyrin [Plutella xylostella]